ncbi:hypothetical protein BHK69_30975 (plasmid) [Bosea vaviloviae]|uniref:Uncharacterized protein n=2 Tax=Bosea vaviloviae TaxID=1526658 RepID=A0A1D7UCL6_9HYPH|nr:hypothetical protein BHK69_30975 [Bosea vaviloviae]
MKTVLQRAIALCSIAIAGTAAAQPEASSTWRPMTFHDFRQPLTSDVLQSVIWPDVIASANAYAENELKLPLNGRNALVTALSSTYQLGDRTVIISTALVRGCDSGANSSGAEIEPSICPLRIVVMKDGKVVSSKTESGCYVDHADKDLPAKNRADSSYTQFDPKSGTIAFRTIVGGKAIAFCQRTYAIN